MADDNNDKKNNEIVEFIKRDAKRLLDKPISFHDGDKHKYLEEYKDPCFRETYCNLSSNNDKLLENYKIEKLFFLVNCHLHVIYPVNSTIPENLDDLKTYEFLNYILENQLKNQLKNPPPQRGGGGNLDEIIRIARSNTQKSKNSENSQNIPDKFNLDKENCNNVLIALIELLEMYLGTLDVIGLFKKNINSAEKICKEIEDYKLKNKDYLDYLDRYGFDFNIIDNEYEQSSFFVGEEVLYNGQRRYIREIKLYHEDKSDGNNGDGNNGNNGNNGDGNNGDGKSGDGKSGGETVVKLDTRSPWYFFTTSTNSKKTTPTSNEIPIEKIKKLPDKRLYDYYQILGIHKDTKQPSEPLNLYISFAKRLYELVRYIFTLTKFKKYVQKYNPADNYIHKEEFEYRFIDFFDKGNTEDENVNKLLNEIEAINEKYSEYIDIEFGDFHVSNDPVSMLFLYTHHGMNLITKQERVYSKNYVHLNPVNPITTHIQPIEENEKNASGFDNTSNQNQSGGGVISTVKDGITYVGDKVLYAGEKMTKGTYDFLWSYNERKNQEYHRNVEYKLYILLDALDIFMNENELKRYKNYYDKYYDNKITLTPNQTVKLKSGLSFLPSNLSHINKREFVFENNVIDNKSEHFIENTILSCALPRKQEVYIPIKYNKLIKDSSSPTIQVTLFEDKEVKIHAIISKKSLVKNKSKIIPGSRPLPKELRGMYEILQQGEKAIGVIKNTDDEKRKAYIVENLRNYLRNYVNNYLKNTDFVNVKSKKGYAEELLKKHIGMFYDKNKDSDYLSGLGSHLKWHITREEKIDILYDELIKERTSIRDDTRDGAKDRRFTRRKYIQKSSTFKANVSKSANSKSTMFLGLSAYALTGATLYHTKNLMKSQKTNTIPSSSFGNFLTKLPKDMFNFGEMIGEGIGNLGGNMIYGFAGFPPLFSIYIAGTTIYMGVSTYKKYMKWKSRCYYEYIANVDSIILEVESSHNLKEVFDLTNLKNKEEINTITVHRFQNIEDIYQVLSDTRWRDIISVDLEYVFINDEIKNIFYRLGLNASGIIKNCSECISLPRPQNCIECINLPRPLSNECNNAQKNSIEVPQGYTLWVLSYEDKIWKWEKYCDSNQDNQKTLYLQKDPINNCDKYSFFNKLNKNVDIFKTRNYIHSLNNINHDTIKSIHTTEFSKHLKMITNKHIFV